MDISAAFDQAFSQIKVNVPKRKEGCYKYHTFDMGRNKGVVFGVFIPDAQMKTFRHINNIIHGWVPYTDNSKSSKKIELKWCTSDNYRGITDEQRELNKQVREAINKYRALFKKVYLKDIKEITLFYFAMRKFINDKEQVEKYDSPNATVMMHTSSRLLKQFQAAIKSKTEALEDPSWMNDYFSREQGVREGITQIKTTRPQGSFGYEVSVTFDKLPKLAVNIDDVILEGSKDLDKEFIKAEFDETYHKNLLEILNKEIANSGNGGNLVDIKETEHKPEEVKIVDAEGK